ncbi:hypothetical protein DB29_01775 [Shouchella clausii]|nr:hypothetical protein DB29_01775 [Shouchella clausii]
MIAWVLQTASKQEATGHNCYLPIFPAYVFANPLLNLPI